MTRRLISAAAADASDDALIIKTENVRLDREDSHRALHYLRSILGFPQSASSHYSDSLCDYLSL